MTIAILEQAEQELEEAFEYYENILPGLGGKYLDSFQNGLEYASTPTHGLSLKQIFADAF